MVVAVLVVVEVLCGGGKVLYCCGVGGCVLW